MNERIKELARQASGTRKHVPAVWQFYDEELQTFAELIIKECISLIEPTEEHRKDASWGYLGGDEGVELIDGLLEKLRKDFGIEE